MKKVGHIGSAPNQTEMTGGFPSQQLSRHRAVVRTIYFLHIFINNYKVGAPTPTFVLLRNH